MSKSFGKQAALKGVNLKLKPGDFLFVTGESGAGKSTFLKILAGEVSPSQGKIKRFQHVGDLNPIQLQWLRRNIGFIRQELRLIDDWTVSENVALPLKILGENSSTIRRRVEESLQMFELGKIHDKLISKCSGGEKQRVAISRAMIGNPNIILADEPTSSLDQNWGWRIFEWFEKLSRSGKVVVLASHDRSLVSSLNKPAICLKNGVPIHLGGPCLF